MNYYNEFEPYAAEDGAIVFTEKEKRAARETARRKLKRPESCSSCLSVGPVHGHHEDYGKPLDVVWLCSQCHGERHRKGVTFLPADPAQRADNGPAGRVMDMVWDAMVDGGWI